MPPYYLTIARLIKRNPLVGVIISAPFVPILGIVLFNNLKEARNFPKAPAVTAFQQAASTIAAPGKGAWVTLTDMKWHCEDKVTESDGDSLIPMTAGSALVIYTPPSKQSHPCEQGATGDATGVLDRINDRRYSFLKNETPQIFGNYSQQNIWTLCGYCSPGNTRGLFYFIGAFFLLFLVSTIVHLTRFLRGKSE